MSSTDANGQQTSYQYDPLGRVTSVILPGDSASQRTTDTRYTLSCAGTSVCVEVDQVQRIDVLNTLTSRSFYDGWGRLVETRTPGVNNQDVVRYAVYDASGRLAKQSNPYFVASGSGYSPPDLAQKATAYGYDVLGRPTSTTDALGNTSTIFRGSVCNVSLPGTPDPGCYEETVSTDANHHQRVSLADALGRTDYEQLFTGNGSGTPAYSMYATSKYAYDYLGDLSAILQPDNSHTTGYTYDALGRLRQLVDPDSGTTAYSYDPAGNLRSSVDARIAAGTVWIGYDVLNLPRWRNSTDSATGAYETFTYDESGHGSGTGRLTSESFSEPGTSLSGGYSYTYDGRGRVTNSTLIVGSASYPLQASYDDEGNLKSQTYPTGEVVTNSYSGDWLTAVSTSQGNTSLLSNAVYAGYGGPARLMTSASLGGLSASWSYDQLLRPNDVRLANGSTTLFEQSRIFDPASNVTSATTTLSGQTDTQGFCYEELNRLTWAGTDASGSYGAPSGCSLPVTPGTSSASATTPWVGGLASSTPRRAAALITTAIPATCTERRTWAGSGWPTTRPATRPAATPAA